jgi:tight adherence protein C
MTLTILLPGLGLLIVFSILFFLSLKPASAGSALLAEVTRSAREDVVGKDSLPSWRSPVSADQLAKPFALFRSFFSDQPNPDLVRRLMLAGYRKPAYSDIFFGARLALPALLGFCVALLVHENTLMFILLTVVVAFFLPDFWLNDAIRRRRERIKLSLPDGLDLLSICMEAGLGLDQGFVRVGQELRVSHPELSEEFLQVNYEQRVGAPRVAAWKAFADRVDVESVRSFVAMLMQTERFGTPIFKALASFSDSLRIQRRQQAEEMAAKTTVKLVLPLALFIFPATFIVTVGPAILTVLRNLGTLFE